MNHGAMVEPDARKLKQFGLLLGVFFPAFFGVLWPWLKGTGFTLWPWLFGAVFLVSGLFKPLALAAFYRLWMRFGLVLGTINTHIVMFVVYVAMFLPMSLVMKIIRRDRLGMRIFKDDPQRTTYKVAASGTSFQSISRRPY